jgi:hypothetical protein
VEAGILSPEEWKALPVVFRYEFDIPTEIDKAQLYISAHGIYEAKINGRRVGDHLLTPGWTPYEYELPYQTFASHLTSDKVKMPLWHMLAKAGIVVDLALVAELETYGATPLD